MTRSKWDWRIVPCWILYIRMVEDGTGSKSLAFTRHLVGWRTTVYKVTLTLTSAAEEISEKSLSPSLWCANCLISEFVRSFLFAIIWKMSEKQEKNNARILLYTYGHWIHHNWSKIIPDNAASGIPALKWLKLPSLGIYMRLHEDKYPVTFRVK